MANSPDTAERTAAAMRAYVTTLFDEMQQRVAHQRAVVLQCLDGLAAPTASADGATQRLRELEDAVRSAIEVLEETKRSFKSKRLGELRENSRWCWPENRDDWRAGLRAGKSRRNVMQTGSVCLVLRLFVFWRNRMSNTVIWIAIAACAAFAPARAGERVVSLGGAVTECVFALGEGARVVAVDDSSGFPTEAAALPRVGYYRMISAEGVLSVKPDLVLASGEAGPPNALTQIERAGVRVVRIPGDASASGCVARVRAVGVALGKTEVAETLASRIDSELADFPPPPGGVPARVLFVFARGAGTLNVAGTNTAADEIIRLAGGVNAVDAYAGYRPLTAEAVVRAAPDVVLLTSSGLAALGGAAALWSIPGMKATPAARRGRVIAMDDLLLLGFGPRLPEAVRTLHQLLYGDSMEANPAAGVSCHGLHPNPLHEGEGEAVTPSPLGRGQG